MHQAKVEKWRERSDEKGQGREMGRPRYIMGRKYMKLDKIASSHRENESNKLTMTLIAEYIHPLSHIQWLHTARKLLRNECTGEMMEKIDASRSMKTHEIFIRK